MLWRWPGRRGPRCGTPASGSQVKPLRALFDLLRGSAASARTAGVWWCGLLVAAIDGTVLDVPDSTANRVHLGCHRSQHGTAGYPQIRLVALVACGTRAVIDAVFGPRSDGETTQALRLLRSLHTGMIVLLDRGLTATPSWARPPALAPTSWSG
jgi:hypothetical protein